MPKLFVLLLLPVLWTFVFSFSWAAEPLANDPCLRFLTGDVPRFIELVTADRVSDIEKVSAFLTRIDQGVTRRYGSHPDVLKLIDLLLDRSWSAGRDITWTHSKVRISKIYKPTTIRYTIPTLVTSEDGQSVAMGSRPSKTSPTLSHILVAIAEAARFEILRNPNLQNIEIVAGGVVNQALIRTLVKLGFNAPVKPVEELVRDDREVLVSRGWGAFDDGVRSAPTIPMGLGSRHFDVFLTTPSVRAESSQTLILNLRVKSEK